jgi:hypothetical protein
MIYARSPYIVHLNDSGLVRAQFKLYIYDGTKDTDKGTADYEFDITAINGTITFDIAPYIRDLLKDRVGPQGTGRYLWVTTEVAKDTGAGLGSFSTWQATQLACYGYTMPEDGVNYSKVPDATMDFEAVTPQASGLLTTALAKNEQNTTAGVFLRNWIVADSDTTLRLTAFVSDSGGLATTISYYTGLNATGTTISTTNITATDNDESDDNLEIITIPTNAKSLRIFDIGTAAWTANILRISGNCGQVTRVFFVNKFGVVEEMHFVGRAVESYTTESNEYKKSILSGGTYSKWRRQATEYRKEAKRSITVNSGHYPEGYNEQFKQLLLSEEVWLLLDGLSATDANNYTPVRIVNSELQYKYSRYDKMINYEMTFEFANDAINTIF